MKINTAQIQDIINSTNFGINNQEVEINDFMRISIDSRAERIVIRAMVNGWSSRETVSLYIAYGNDWDSNDKHTLESMEFSTPSGGTISTEVNDDGIESFQNKANAMIIMTTIAEAIRTNFKVIAEQVEIMTNKAKAEKAKANAERQKKVEAMVADFNETYEVLSEKESQALIDSVSQDVINATKMPSIKTSKIIETIYISKETGQVGLLSATVQRYQNRNAWFMEGKRVSKLDVITAIIGHATIGVQ
ncbi:hypothetical protein VCHA53O466_140050 [Vibrio chagasii]|nr:hypothetical protein VCHA53O466_140050 [Vibrio chagasii]